MIHLVEVGANLDNMVDPEVNVEKIPVKLTHAGTNVDSVMRTVVPNGGCNRHVRHKS